MPLTTKFHLLLTAARMAIAAFLAAQWLRAHDAYLRADARSQANQSALAQLAKQQFDLAQQLKQAQSAQQSQLTAMKKQYAQAQQSPGQLAALITTVMKLPQPIRIITPAPTPDTPNPPGLSSLPDPASHRAKGVRTRRPAAIRHRTATPSH